MGMMLVMMKFTVIIMMTMIPEKSTTINPLHQNSGTFSKFGVLLWSVALLILQLTDTCYFFQLYGMQIIWALARTRDPTRND